MGRNTRVRGPLGLWPAIRLVLAAPSASSSAAPRLPTVAWAILLALDTLLLSLLLAGGATLNTVDRFLLLSVVTLPLAAVMTTIFETRRARALEFFRVLAQPVHPRWLILLPLGALCLAAAAIFLTILPPLAALSMLGCLWWAVSVGHAFAGPGRRWTSLFAIPLSLAGPIVAGFADDVGGWAAAAGVTMAMGVAAAFLSPRHHFFSTSASRASVGMPSSRGATRDPSSLVDHRGSRWTAARLFWFTPAFLNRGGWGFLIVLFVAVIAQVLLTLVRPTIPPSFVIVMLPGMAMGRANLKSARAFLLTLPITRGQIVCATIIPWVALASIQPLVGIARAVTTETISPADVQAISRSLASSEPDAPVPVARFPADAARTARVNHPRQAANAGTVLTSALKGRLIHTMVRSALLAMAAFFAFAGLSIVSEKRSWGTWQLGYLAILLLSIGLSVATSFTARLPRGFDSLWAAAILLAVAWMCCARQLSFNRALGPAGMVRIKRRSGQRPRTASPRGGSTTAR